MAAKQGLTAHLSQAGEDAKRAVLSRTGVTTSSWFSNLNTVCTIKSAPPRSPEVLEMLSSKSGWLFKRNEQHVWQARWCCVVPHSFLYYFDVNIVPGQDIPLPMPTPEQQEEWNDAVQNGLGNRREHEKRSSLYLFNQSSAAPSSSAAAANQNAPNSATSSMPENSSEPNVNKVFTSSTQPAGIIDLECYTDVHRSSKNPLVMELAGDDAVNPDLRGFYFCGQKQEEIDEWTNALLNGRHASLQDETDAYKQVCDGFAQQLQLLHSELDDATKGQEEAKDDLYRVRSHVEDVRRSCWRMVEDCLEGQAQMNPDSSNSQQQQQQEQQQDQRLHPLYDKRSEFRTNMETIRRQDMSVSASVQLLCQYTKSIDDVCWQQYQENLALQADLKETGQSDQQKVRQLTSELESLREEYERDKKTWESQMETATSKYQQSQKDLKDVQKDLNSTRMEVTMFQSQQKNKIGELQQHKKILKKEVIGLRQKLEDALSKLSAVKHQQESYSMREDQLQQKNDMLERYVNKIESQVQIQQNMMEMMSQSGAGSVAYGSIVQGDSGSIGGGNGRPSPYRDVVVDRHGSFGGSPRKLVSQNIHDVMDITSIGEDDDDSNGDGFEGAGLLNPSTMQNGDHDEHGISPRNGVRGRRGRNGRCHVRSPVDDSDNKSQISEITEDRTQRHFDAVVIAATAAAANRDYNNNSGVSPYHPPTEIDGGRGGNGHPGSRMMHSSSAFHQQIRHQQHRSSPLGPPSFIGVNNTRSKKYTINSGRIEEDGVNEVGEDHGDKEHHHHNHRSLETIHSSASSLPPITPPPPALFRRSDIPRSNGSNRSFGFGGEEGSVASENKIHRQSQQQQKGLSVAQRARLEADKKLSTPVRVRLDDLKSADKSLTPQQRLRHELNNGNSLGRNSSSGSVNSQQSGLWRRFARGDFGGEMDELNHPSHDNRANNNKTPIRATRRRGPEEEKKNNETPLSSEKKPLTLQERSQIQRQKQLDFLKKKGLIHDNDDVSGGAGVGSSSVASKESEERGNEDIDVGGFV